MKDVIPRHRCRAPSPGARSVSGSVATPPGAIARLPISIRTSQVEHRERTISHIGCELSHKAPTQARANSLPHDDVTPCRDGAKRRRRDEPFTRSYNQNGNICHDRSNSSEHGGGRFADRGKSRSAGAAARNARPTRWHERSEDRWPQRVPHALRQRVTFPRQTVYCC